MQYILSSEEYLALTDDKERLNREVRFLIRTLISIKDANGADSVGLRQFAESAVAKWQKGELDHPLSV